MHCDLFVVFQYFAITYQCALYYVFFKSSWISLWSPVIKKKINGLWNLKLLYAQTLPRNKKNCLNQRKILKNIYWSSYKCVCVCVLVHMFIYSLISQCVLFCDQSDQMTTHSNFVRILILLCRELFSNPLYLFGSFFFIGLIFFHFPHVVEFFFFIFYKGFTLQFLIFFSFNLFSFYFF